MKSETIGVLLLAGSIFCCAFGGGRVKEDVVIGGVAVGGMEYEEAVGAIRACARPPRLVIRTPARTVDVTDGLTVSDNAADLVRRAKRGERLSLTYTRNWADAERVLRLLCAENARAAQDATMTFSARGFEYTAEREGVVCDFRGALLSVANALRTGGEEVALPVRTYSPAVTERSLREKTAPLSRFSTDFDAENAPRRHNIALAAARIAGTVVPPHGEFSFNAAVGERTEENGFRVASVILDGEFVPGVGGGVCQASTTLFGAALRAGMRVTESRAHSLSVGYAPPSLDAMVSQTSDLRFVNPYDEPVYILSSVLGGRVSFFFYGKPDGRRYEAESAVLARIPPPGEEVVEGEEDRVLRNAKEGLESESYLVVYGPDGAQLSRTRIRRDRYAAVRGKVMKKSQETQKSPPNE